MSLVSHANETNLWHQRLGHINFKDLARLSRHEIIRGLPNLISMDSQVCGGCQLGKQTKSTHKRLSQIGTNKPLELLHIDLVGPTRTESLGGKRYFLVVVDDFSRYTWVAFLRDKSEAFDELMILCKRIQNEKDSTIKKIRSDH